ncbi:MAG: DUF6249 domain-containing protein [Mediterranea sp.]|jgi:predicted PurR-regulated permease PerM|nr:DUF6249 domain-containing protein [Mediterranea sp.]
MKRITLLFIAIIACLVIAAAQADTSAIQQSLTNTRIEYTDTSANPDHIERKTSNNHESFSLDFLFNPNLIPITTIVCIFGLTMFIVFISYYFKYKNKKARYKLAEQALAAGQPIPEEFFNEKAGHYILQKGIADIFTGIGLFIFLWGITEEFSIGCIGLLIMFTGFGKLVIHYTSNKRKEIKKPDNKE